MPAPTIVSSIMTPSTDSSFGLPPPSGAVADDVILTILETPNRAIDWDSSAPGRWTPIAAIGTGTAGAAGSSRLSAAWRRSDGVDHDWLNLSGLGEHTYRYALLIRGCIAAGDPIDAFAVHAITSNGVRDVVLPGLTTLSADTLVVPVYGHPAAVTWPVVDSGSWANADLASLTRMSELSSAIGRGGGVVPFHGPRAAAGAVGATTATVYDAPEVKQPYVGLTIALRSVAPAPSARPWFRGRFL